MDDGSELSEGDPLGANSNDGGFDTVGASVEGTPEGSNDGTELGDSDGDVEGFELGVLVGDADGDSVPPYTSS